MRQRPVPHAATANPTERHSMPPTASSQKWFAVATITTSVAVG